VLEIAQEGLLDQSGAGGRLIRIDGDGDRTTMIDEGLSFPTSVAVTDDSIYISNCGTCAGEVPRAYGRAAPGHARRRPWADDLPRFGRFPLIR
jgi:hypothetical protein